MAQVLEKTSEEESMQEIAGKVATAATGVALAAGIVAIGALVLSDEKTRQKITRETNQVFHNFGQLIQFIKKHGQPGSKFLKELEE